MKRLTIEMAQRNNEFVAAYLARQLDSGQELYVLDQGEKAGADMIYVATSIHGTVTRKETHSQAVTRCNAEVSARMAK